jgi:CBS domain-containing protein
MFDTSHFTAADVMTRDVVTVRPDDTLRRAAQLMIQRGVAGLPVVDVQGRVVGVVSEADLVRPDEAAERRVHRWLDMLADGEALAPELLATIDTANRPVAKVMRTDPIKIAETTPLREVANLVGRDNVRRVLVVTDEKLVGIVARRDLVKALASGH